MSDYNKNLLDLSSRQLRRLVNKDSKSMNSISKKVKFTSPAKDEPATSKTYMQESVVVQQHNVDDKAVNIVENDGSINFNYDEVMDELISTNFTEIPNKPSDDVPESKFQSKLAYWAVKYKVNHVILSALLELLRSIKIFENLPKDPRTLLQTPRKSVIRKVEPGYYLHRGIAKGISQTLIPNNDVNEIELTIGIDGLPISESNNSQLWPILGSINQSSVVFLIGAYHGYTKPADSNDFLNDFVEELKIVLERGVTYNNRDYKVKISNIICDAPAKSFVTKTKGHTGYSSCSKCNQRGVYDDNCRRMYFPDINSPKRTDEDFILQTDEDYHLGQSILTTIPNFGMVTNIPLDYMHLVCIGVVKKIITLWFNGPLNVRLPHQKVLEISERLISIRGYIIDEFARLPQGLQVVNKWKATELRLFLLYLSPIVLHKIVGTNIYHHFLTLHVAIRILCNKQYLQEYTDYSQSLLEHFVDSFKIIYNETYLSHNLHGLLHLVDDAKNFGPLDAFSAFPFENFMRTIKRDIRKHDKPLQQLDRRCEERECVFQNTKILKDSAYTEFLGKHNDGPVLKASIGESYMSLKTNEYLLSSKPPNNCCLINNLVVEVYNFVYTTSCSSMVLIGKQYLEVTDFYTKPCPSSLVGILLVRNLSKNLESWPISEITKKCMKIPFHDGFVVLPLLHSA